MRVNPKQVRKPVIKELCSDDAESSPAESANRYY